MKLRFFSDPLDQHHDLIGFRGLGLTEGPISSYLVSWCTPHPFRSAQLKTQEATVLFIEDERSDAELACEIRNSDSLHNWKITHTDRLVKGIDLARKGQFDVLLLGLSLPESKGFETLKRVQSEALNIPIVVLTGQEDQDVALEAIKSGVLEYVIKDHCFKCGELLIRAITYSIERHSIVSEWRQTVRMLRDISERKQNWLKVLNEIARIVNSRLDLKSMLDAASEALAENLGARRVGAFVCQENLESLKLVASKDSQDGSADLKSEFPLRGTRFNDCLESQKPLYTSNLKQGSGSRMTLIECGLVSEVIVPIMGEDAPLGALSVARSRENGFTEDDIEFMSQVAIHFGTGMKNAMLYEELQHAYETLQKSQEQILQQERLNALGAMASGICHDFNNALTPILGFSEMLLKFDHSLDTEERNSYLRTISRRAKDASQVVQRLRNFYRKRGERELFTGIQINDLILEVVDITRPRWKDQAMLDDRNITLQTEMEDLPYICGNQAELREALVNMVFNAIDAIHGNGRINLRTKNLGKEMQIEVEDDGAGMSPEARKSCLEPFFTTKGENGTGLGLAVVFGIISRHDGKLDIRSEEGKGTCFTITLPQYPSSISHDPDEEVQPVAMRRVLVVDDEPEVVTVVSEYLKMDGHKVQTARSGSEALECFSKGDFDLVITDRGMPEMNGDKMATVIKELAPEIPVIMLSGFADVMKATADQPEAIDCIISKPISLNGLRKAMADVAE
jgi:signal transduction histidine kinase/DNA-binding response OmpR family regulator